MIEAKKGVPQKDALSCSVNIFCEKVILSTESVTEAIKKGNLAAFADDILVSTDTKTKNCNHKQGKV